MNKKAGVFLATASFLLLSVVMTPRVAEASLLSFLGLGTSARAEEVSPTHNSQTIPLADAHVGISKETTLASATETALVLSTTDGTAIIPETGPLGTISDVEEMPTTGDTGIYVVRAGDTVPAIAKMFEVSEDTIYWANDLTKGQKLKVGEIILIPPTTGVLHTVKKGETLASIAKKYKVTVSDIVFYNEVSEGDALSPGDTIMVPDGKIDAPKPVAKKPAASSGSINMNTPKVTSGYWMRPLALGRWVRGRHGSFCGNGVDLSDKLGTPVYAAGPGVVIMSKNNNAWNGGAGNVVMINHTDLGPNVRSIYAHLQRTNVSVGQTVAKGDVIGFLGSTGRSTGPHLHIEFCGTQNPLIGNPNFGL